MAGIVFSLIVLGFLTLVARAFIWNSSRRAKMTAEEREQDDRDEEVDSSIW